VTAGTMLRLSRRVRSRVVGAGWPHPPASALMVIVPAAAPLARVGGRPPPRIGGLPPHITVLYPFLPPSRIDAGIEDDIGTLLARFEPFGFRLERVGRFPGVLYVAPEPAERFTELMDALCRHWPALRPYNGAHAQVVPHLTVATEAERPVPPAALQAQLPVAAVASEVSLMIADRRGRWSCRRSFRLGHRS
jgi:2'-5' RNA ligase